MPARISAEIGRVSMATSRPCRETASDEGECRQLLCPLVLSADEDGVEGTDSVVSPDDPLGEMQSISSTRQIVQVSFGMSERTGSVNDADLPSSMPGDQLRDILDAFAFLQPPDFPSP